MKQTLLLLLLSIFLVPLSSMAKNKDKNRVDLSKMSQIELIDFLYNERVKIDNLSSSNVGETEAKQAQAWQELRSRVTTDGDTKSLKKLVSKIHPDVVQRLEGVDPQKASSAMGTLMNLIKGSSRVDVPFKSTGTLDNFMIGEKFFSFKHLKSAVYQYPKEIRNFMIANGIIMYAQCFGANAFSSKQSIYEARNLDPVCVQNLVELFTSPLFYGAFGAFMVGSRYGTPAALNAFEKIRNRPGGSRMTAQSARFWSMQLGMAIGFFADQVVHRLYKSKDLRQCATSMGNFAQSGKDPIDTQAMENGENQAELTILNDQERHCARAFRELGSTQSLTFLSSSLLSLGTAATLGGVISRPLIQKGAMGGKLVGDKAWTIILQKIKNGKALWGFRAVGKGIAQFGMMTAGITHMTVFLGLSYILSPIIDKAFKVTTHTFNFKDQAFDLQRQFQKYSEGKDDGSLKCPESYFSGRALEGSGQCSQLGPIASLRTYHDYQKAWRTDNLLQKFMMGYQGWRKKWDEFHSVYMATRDIYQNLAQLREFKNTGAIVSLENSLDGVDQQILAMLNSYAESIGETPEAIFQRVTAAQEGRPIQLTNEEEMIRLYMSMGDAVESGYKTIAEKELFYILKPELSETATDVVTFTSVIVDPDVLLDEVKAALKESRKSALANMAQADQDFYLEVNKVRQTREDGSVLLGGRFADLSEARQKRFYGRFLRLSDQLTAFESRVWTGYSQEEQWFDRRLSEQSELTIDQRLDFAAARKMVFSDNKELISLGLTILRKLSHLSPQTSYKRDVAVLLDGFYPKYQYSDVILALQANYAQLAGEAVDRQVEYFRDSEARDEFSYDTSFRDEAQASYKEHIEATKDQEKNHFWKRTRTPFVISDLYDHVLTQALCERQHKGNDLFTNPEGRALEFHPPELLPAANPCLRTVSLNRWGQVKGMSVKNSLFLDPEGNVRMGLFDYAIHSEQLPPHMDDEQKFIEWWNSTILSDLKQIVTEMERRYHQMTADNLLPLFSNHRLDLELAIAGLQVLSFEGWFSQLPEKTYFYDLIGSLVSKRIEHGNFKQSNDLGEAWANEFGFLANILAVQLEKLDRFGAVNQSDDSASHFLPEALAVSAPPSDNQVKERVLNLKAQFLRILSLWEHGKDDIYADSLEEFMKQIEAISGLYFDGSPDAPRMMSDYLTADEAELFKVGPDQSSGLLELIKDTKITAVILSQLVDIVEEVKDVRIKRRAEEFNFSLSQGQ